jgi:hypothetical protein
MKKPTVSELQKTIEDLKARIVEIERTLFNAQWNEEKAKTLFHLNKDKK